MIWLTGIVAIALMLILLAISPSQLMSLNLVHSQYYQWAGYVLLSLAGLCTLITYFIKAPSDFSSHSTPATSSHFPQSSSFQPIHLTPWYTLMQQGKIALFAKVACVLLFWLAVICHGLAQRVDMVQAMPTQPIYVDALVTPTELSDKRLIVNASKAPQNQANKSIGEVNQGYRQLVTLTDIRPYNDYEAEALNNESNNKSSNLSSSNQLTDNPFTSSQDNPSNQSSTKTDISQADHSQLAPSQPTPYQSMTVMLNSYQADAQWLNNLAPNKQMRMRLKLRPLEVEEAQNGFNEYRWLSTRHATAIAEIIDANPQDMIINDDLDIWQKINTYRYQLREHFLQSSFYNKSSFYNESSFYNDNKDDGYREEITDSKQDAAITLSLLTGDRSLISSEMTGLYRFAGISHLLAISGAHVLFLAILCALLASLLADICFPQLYRVLPRWQLRFLVAVSVAFLYAMFAGFDVPAVRTAWMLVIVGLVRYLLATPSIFKVLLVLAVAMAWHDIFVLWQAGYWLSFIAVAVLIVYSQRFSYQAKVDLENTYLMHNHNHIYHIYHNAQSTETTAITKAKHLVIDFFKLQLWMSVALLPISLWLFGKVSLWGFLVNLFAIGLFGWVIVPLNLFAGLMYTISPTLADVVWTFVTWILSTFHNLLMTLQASANQVGWIHTEISLPILLLLMLVALPWMLPKGMISRYLSLPVLMVVGIASATTGTGGKQTQLLTIDTNNTNVFAILIKSDEGDWLLLSAYNNSYANGNKTKDKANFKKASKNGNKKSSPILNEKQTAQLSVHLYDRLRANKVDVLTGIVVQTATPEMAGIVANLRREMPISYYWQAGLNANKAEVTSYLQDVHLTPQACVAGRQYQQDVSLPILTLQAVTGWQDINDDNVHDCTIRIHSLDPVVVVDGNSKIELKSTSDSSTKTSNKTNIKAKENERSTDILLHTSPHLRLSKLWSLLCLDGVIIDENSTSTNHLSSNATTDTIAITLSNHHLLVSPKSIVDKKLLDIIQPQSLHIVGDYQNNVSKDLKETKLAWEQGATK